MGTEFVSRWEESGDKVFRLVIAQCPIFSEPMTPVYSARTWTAGAVVERSGFRLVCVAEQVVAAVLLVLLAPLGVLIAGVIMLLSKRSALVTHLRVGWKGEALALVKFRTMWQQGSPGEKVFVVEPVSGAVPEHKNGNDMRVTSGFARFCRRYSIDELPQLYHVARGQMSFVGPRPVTAREIEDYYGDCADELVSVRPGLTGLWQVLGRNTLSYEERRRLDLILVRDVSTSLYWKILLRTVPAVLQAKGSH